MEAKTGYSVFAEPLSTSERAVKGVSGGVKLAQTVMTVVTVVEEASAGIKGLRDKVKPIEPKLKDAAKGATAGLPRKKAGPVGASATEPVTGKVFARRNEASEELEPVLARRVAQHSELAGAQRDPFYAKPGEEHADILAVNDVVRARRIALGIEQTEADLAEVTLHVQEAGGSNAGIAKARCTRCFLVTEGVNTTSSLRAAEKAQFKDILSGKLNLPNLQLRKF